MAEETDKKEYLVRGAVLCCRQGTHPRRPNLPMSHGVYAYEHPQITDDDCTPENISHFGVCCSETPPEGAEVVRLAGYVPEGSTEQAEDVQWFYIWVWAVSQVNMGKIRILYTVSP